MVFDERVQKFLDMVLAFTLQLICKETTTWKSWGSIKEEYAYYLKRLQKSPFSNCATGRDWTFFTYFNQNNS